jgi:simple sugar transport system permease protein
MRAILSGAFGKRDNTFATIARSVPIAIVALGWIVAFRCKRINLGLEGQVTVGGIAAAIVGIELDAPAGLHLLLCVFFGVLAGAAYAAIPAFLWSRRHVNDALSTLMSTFVAGFALQWIVREPLRDSSFGANVSKALPSGARWSSLVDGTALTWVVVPGLCLVGLVAFALRRSRFGFYLRFTGENPRVLEQAGVSTKQVGALSLVVSGAFGGLAGSTLVLAGSTTRLTASFSAGVGFTGIVVALLARNSPIGVLPAALFFSALSQGGTLMEIRTGVPSEVVLVTQALVVIGVAATAMVPGVVVRRARRRRAAEPRLAHAEGV